MIVGCYDLRLYCDTDECNGHDEYPGSDRADSYRQARKAGWKIGRHKPDLSRQAFCPSCTGRESSGNA